jgi:amidohydrolase
MEETFVMDLVAFRKELHRNPEVSQKEFETQKRIISFLKQIGIEGKVVGITGVMVVFDSGKAGKTIMLRSDHDALPIQEVNEFEHKSLVDGVSHKCGHDGHTAIMCGVAKHIKDHPISKGKVILLFQPAEENGEGAKAVLADKEFDFKPDLVFALHNLPKYALHAIVCKEGSFTAAAKSIIIKLDGKTSHAAEPELGINPARAISELVQMFDKVKQPDLDRDDFALTSPIYIHMGELSYGVTAGHGEVHYTLRTWNNETMNKLSNGILLEVERIAQNHQLRSTISWTEEFSSNQNHPDAVSIITESIKENGFKNTERSTPFKWGEDFGLLLPITREPCLV